MADEISVRNLKSLVELATQYATVRSNLGGSPKSLEDKDRLQHHWKRFSDALKQQPAIDPVQMAQSLVDMQKACQIMADSHNSDSGRDKRHIAIMNAQVQRYQDTMVRKFTALSAAPANQVPSPVENAAPSVKPPPPTSPRPLAAGERPPHPAGPPPVKLDEAKENEPQAAKRGFFRNMVNRVSDFFAETRRTISDFTLAVSAYLKPTPPPENSVNSKQAVAANVEKKLDAMVNDLDKNQGERKQQASINSLGDKKLPEPTLQQKISATVDEEFNRIHQKTVPLPQAPSVPKTATSQYQSLDPRYIKANNPEGLKDVKLFEDINKRLANNPSKDELVKMIDDMVTARTELKSDPTLNQNQFDDRYYAMLNKIVSKQEENARPVEGVYQKLPISQYGQIPTREPIVRGYVSLNENQRSEIENKNKLGYGNIPSMPSANADNDYIAKVEPLSRENSVASNIDQGNAGIYSSMNDIEEKAIRRQRSQTMKDGVYNVIPTITEYTSIPASSEEAHANEMLGSNSELPHGFIPTDKVADGLRDTNTAASLADQSSEPQDHSQKNQDFKSEWNNNKQKLSGANKPLPIIDAQPSDTPGIKPR